jgi:large subunit ribosomal protein L30e|tara:strand:+ start:156 stop:443 length:288 start_codon:yes stop_codon:yes gene_type:complete
MAKAKKITSSEIKKLIQAKNLVIGTERTLRNLKLGKVEKVIVSSNCPEKIFDDINHCAEMSKTEAIKVSYPNEELGVICKKPFSISVLSILKGAK